MQSASNETYRDCKRQKQHTQHTPRGTARRTYLLPSSDNLETFNTEAVDVIVLTTVCAIVRTVEMMVTNDTDRNVRMVEMMVQSILYDVINEVVDEHYDPWFYSCYICQEVGTLHCCTRCPRAFHARCVYQKYANLYRQDVDTMVTVLCHFCIQPKTRAVSNWLVQRSILDRAWRKQHVHHRNLRAIIQSQTGMGMQQLCKYNNEDRCDQREDRHEHEQEHKQFEDSCSSEDESAMSSEGSEMEEDETDEAVDENRPEWEDLCSGSDDGDDGDVDDGTGSESSGDSNGDSESSESGEEQEL